MVGIHASIDDGHYDGFVTLLDVPCRGGIDVTSNLFLIEESPVFKLGCREGATERSLLVTIMTRLCCEIHSNQA